MPLRLKSRVFLTAAGLIAVLALSTSRLTGVAHATAGARRVGSAPTLPAGAHRIGRLARASVLSVDIALKPRSASALADYAHAVSSRASSDFRRYLTVAQIRRRFGPTQAGVAAVRAALRRAGLTAALVSANGLLIRVRATVARLDSALGVELERVRLSSGRMAYANRRAPRFAAGVAGLIQGVVGLDDLVQPRSLGLHRSTDATGPRAPERIAARAAEARSAGLTAAVSGAPTAAADCGAGALATQDSAYTPDEIASAYGFDSLYSAGDYGAGETVALMEYEPYATSDVEAFENCFTVNGTPIGGGSAADVHEIDVDGGADAQGTNQYGSGEAALDIEEVLSVAPDADVDVYETSDYGSDASTLDAYNAMVETDTVDVISTSWGECEAALQEGDPALAKEENAIFEEAASEGISVFAASGDEGSSACADELSGAAASAAAVEDPGSQPYVTSVGGTSLPSDTDVAAQTVWDDTLGAGGGGVSTLWTMPAYQRTAATTLNGIISASSSSSACGASTGTYCREIPDVSADADPDTGYTIYWEGNWYAIAGTSAAAPLWAGLAALADDSSACAGQTIGFANAVLYAVAANPTEYANDFTDVTSGSNALFSLVGGLFGATAGYDMATGLGTPKAATLVPDLCSAAASLGTGRTRVSSPPTWPTTLTTSGTTATTTPTAPSTPVVSAPPASSSSPTVTPATSSPAPSTEPVRACTQTVSLRHAAAALALSRSHPSATLSVSFTAPDTARCTSDALTLALARHITTTERGGARARDTLKIQLLNSAGRLVRTLATLSGAEARSGYQTMKLTLGAADAGQRLTLRFLARRGGTATTAFTLRSLALQEA